MIDTPAKVIIAFVVPAPRAKDREVANSVPQARPGLGARSRLEFRKEIPWKIVADADDKLAAALLGNAKLPCILHLGVDAVPKAAASLAQRARFPLHSGKVGTPCRVAQTEDILHHKHSRLEEIHTPEEFFVQLPARVML